MRNQISSIVRRRLVFGDMALAGPGDTRGSQSYLHSVVTHRDRSNGHAKFANYLERQETRVGRRLMTDLATAYLDACLSQQNDS